MQKPNIPIMGFKKSATGSAPKATAPAMGSVHERETSTKVRAMKNVPIWRRDFRCLTICLSRRRQRNFKIAKQLNA